MGKLDGKKAIITGAGSGIGKATAIRFAAEGARVACVDLRGAQDTVSQIGGDAFALDCNIADASAVESMVDSAVATMGGLDILCNIAGIGHFAWSHEEPPAEFDKILAVNLNGTFYTCRFALPHLLAGGGGVIVNTASTAGLIGQPWSAAYCASKGGVVMLTRALAYEYRDQNIRVVGIAPGGTNTNIISSFSSLPEGANYKLISKLMTPVKNADPSEIAGAFIFVASDDGRFITGSILTIDGGIVC